MKFYVVITVFIAFVLIVNIVSSKTLSRQRRVINGKVEQSIIPFMASIRMAKDFCYADYSHWNVWKLLIYGTNWFGRVAYHSHRCGGSIITARHILTAAHCTYTIKDKQLKDLIPATNFSVAVGSQRWEAGNNQIYCVKRIINHQDFIANPYDLLNDISIFLLERFINLGDPTRIAIMPLNSLPFDSTNETVTVYGWGCYTTEHNRSSEYLRSTELTISGYLDTYGIYEPYQSFYVRNASTRTRSGDSGAPLVDQNGQQVGVYLARDKSDKVQDPLSYYACIYHYYYWIQSTIAKEIN